MKKQLLIIFLICGAFNNLNSQSQKLEDLLFELPDIIFQELDSTEDYGPTYQLKIKQPLDHSDKSKGFFYQKVFLTHRGFDRPTVIVTEGYAMWENSNYELTDLLNANQIKVEHRYFGDSKPDTMNYSYLNLKQATADLHHVRILLSEIYSGEWISTGLSKGGVTAIVYRYFYPDDIDACVPYVAPIITNEKDPRFITFLDSVLGIDCCNKIRTFQINLLENREKILPLLEIYILGTKAKYNKLTLDQVLESAVLEYPSSILEYGWSCEEIPGNEESIENIVKHFLSVQPIHYYSDKWIKKFTPYIFQAATELGHYKTNKTGLENFLVTIPDGQDILTRIALANMSVKYDGKLMSDVLEWLNTEGDKFIYLYGAKDYWTAGAVTPNKDVNSEWFFLNDLHHENTRISAMTDIERQRLVSTLEDWLSLEIEDVFHKKE